MTTNLTTDRFELILNMATEGFWDWDLVTDRVYLSPRYCELVGYSPVDTISGSDLFRTIIHPDDRFHVFSVFEEHLRCIRNSSVIEFRVISKDGTVRWVEGRCRNVGIDDEGIPSRMVGTIFDITDRREIEKKHRQSEEKFSTAFRLSPDSININRYNDGMYIEINQGFTAITGYTAEDVIGRTSLELNIWVDIQDRIRLLAELKERGVVNNLEAQFRRKNGTILTGLMSARIIEIEGEPCILSIVRDITDRKIADEVVRNSNNLLQTIINTAPVRVFWKNTELSYLGCNIAFARDAGVACPDELTGKNDYQLGWKDQAVLYRTDDMCVIETGIPKLFYEERQTTPDGDMKWLRTSKVPLRNESEETIGILGIYEDITEYKKSEEALRKNEERHRSILRTAMDGIWLMDTQGHILEVNDAFCQLSGYSARELLTMRIHDLVADKISDDLDARIQTILRQGNARFESRYRCRDGSIIDVEISAQYRQIDDGQILYFLRDITGRRRAEAELQKKNAEIEQFIYTVSHDLRSPLVTVKAFLGYLENDMVDGNRDQCAQDLQFIHGAADKMKLLLDELLELSRIDHMETHPVEVSLRELLDDVLITLAGVINERKAEIRLPTADLMLSMDRQHLFRIWQNLIENAIKYSRNDCIPLVEIGIRVVREETIFFIKDNGIGVNPHYHSRIFRIFEKLDSKSQGAGLGLSMIRRIIEKSGGRIWIESDGDGKGACFFFTLPQAMVK